jgi:hypothetical protein
MSRAAEKPGKSKGRSDASVRRTAERALVDAETRVADADAELARLETALADPTLYIRADSKQAARELTAARDRARELRDKAFAVWEAAEAAVR